MLLKYTHQNGAHIKIVPLVPVGGEGNDKKLTRSQVSLFPGTNEVTDDEWAVMSPHIAGELKSGVITPLEREGKAQEGETGKRKLKNLTEFPVKVAVSFVKQCVNPDTLKKWYDEEVREEVRVRIVKRMEKLKVAIPDDTERNPRESDELEGDEDEPKEPNGKDKPGTHNKENLSAENGKNGKYNDGAKNH